MTMTLTPTGKRRLTRIASEYRSQGYRVVTHPRQDELPAFLHGFEPALIAMSDDENVVLDIRSREQFSDTRNSLVSLAAAVEKQPGWRLELVSTGSQYTASEIPSGVEPDIHEIRSRIGIAREMLDEGQGEVAALIAWSAAEAILRRLAETNDIVLEQRHPEAVLTQLYFVGLLSDMEFDVLRRAVREQVVIAHGFNANVAPGEWVPPLIETASGLLTDSVR